MISCPQCGTMNPDNFKFCLECGTKIDGAEGDSTLQDEELIPGDGIDSEDEDEDEGAGPGETQSIANDGKIECWKCKALIEAGSVFCPKCGAPQEDSADKGTGTAFMNTHDDSAKSAAKARLVILEPSGKEGMIYNVMEGENICGREDGFIIIEDECVSPRHCSLIWENDKLYVEDLKSLNGVFLKITGEVDLHSNSLFRIGRQLLFYQHVSDFPPVENAFSADGTKFAGSPAKSIWGKIARVTANGGMGAQTLLMKPQLAIGREVGDVTFPQDGFVSGSHARISYANNKASLADLGSSNGTYLKLNGRTQVDNRELLLVGQKLLRVEYL